MSNLIAEEHNNLATRYAKNRQFKLALEQYKLAVHAAPDFLIAHYNLGLLLLENNLMDAAQIQFQNVISLNPHHEGALFYLSGLAIHFNQLDQAANLLQQLLTQNSNNLDALVNMGVVALKKDQRQLAIDYFTKALVLDETHLEARNNIAATFMHFDRFENALVHYDVLLKQDPHNLEYHYNIGVAQMSLGHLQLAQQHFLAILDQNDQHFAALNNLAAIQLRLSNRPAAISYLERAIMANPLDNASQFMLNALTHHSAKLHACHEYVQNLFNNYALYYETHMLQTLHYSLPQHIARTLHQLQCLKVNHALDLGCGTGLSGSVLREISQHLTGVDLANKMLEHAKAKNIYDVLINAECIDFLTHETQQYDLVVASDMLPYLGDLEEFFTAIKPRLLPNAILIFSCEISTSEPWFLQESMRFCHHPDYIRNICNQHQLQMITNESLIARHQDSHDLPVTLYVTMTKTESLTLDLFQASDV